MKKRSYRKLIGITAAVLMVFSMLSLEILDAYAINPTYTVSTDYKNSKYYTNLTRLTLTGNQRSDVVRIALTQLGYHEGNSTADFAGGNTNGSRNFVEYNRLHGKLDNDEGNGYSYGYYWCAAFATWCAAQAGIPNSVVPTTDYIGVSTQRLRTWFMNNANYYARGSYTPITGDYIFFKSAGAAVPTNHVGLVMYVKGNTVYTIEGNAGSVDCVALKEYSLNDTYIVGYGVPKYKTGTAIAFDLTNKANTGEYITTASSLAIRSGASASYSALGALPHATVIMVDEINGNWGKITYGGVTGWISLSYAYPLSMAQIRITYDANGGTGAPAAQGKQPGVPIMLSTSTPKRGGYAFVGWSTSPTATKALYAAGGSYTADESIHLYAVWREETYVIQFADHNGKVLQSKTYSYGDTVTPPASPTRAADQTYRYTFSGWGKTVTKADASVTYTAQYEKSYIDYTVLFCDEDGTVLSRELYHYNDTIKNPPVPEKAADKTYSYTFIGWGEPLVRVTGDKTYTAVYDKTYLEYLITFSDENGIILSQEMYHYGDTVKQPSAPTKKSDTHYDYIFLGWDKEVSPVEGMTFYTATYAKQDRRYTVTFRNADGTEVASDGYAYGASVTLPADPKMATDEKYEYAFVGWSSDGETVSAVLPATADAVYTAVYALTPVEYTIVFRDESGNVYSSETYHYGDVIRLPADPVKAATIGYTYVFSGWGEDVSKTVEGDATYVAQFTAVPRIGNKKPGVNNILSPGQEEGAAPILGISILLISTVAIAGGLVYVLTKRRK